MKIIQSFWSGNQKEIDKKFGWHDSKYNWMGWILSVNQLIKYYDKVELYTDDFGYEILINKLKLPYTKVHVVLNELDCFPSELWALAKIKVYSIQNEPFIHVDGDVFIWKAFPDNFHTASLLAQNIETATDYYFFTWNKMLPFLSYIPAEMKEFNIHTSNLSANMGITGGSDVLFFKEYAQKAFEFVEKNKQSWNDISLFNFNVFFEQVLFYRMAEIKEKDIHYLFSQIWADNLYEGFGDFHLVPYQKNYLHLLGDFKRNASVCKAMESYIKKKYPDHFSTLISLYQNGTEDLSHIILDDKIVALFLQQFDSEIKNHEFIEKDYILKRDLNNVNLYELYHNCLNDRKDFKIVRLPGFKIFEKDEIKMIDIEESNSQNRIFELDEIDELLLDELNGTENYFNLLKKMNFYLEDQNDFESINELRDVINGKIGIYITLKIISIYSYN